MTSASLLLAKVPLRYRSLRYPPLRYLVAFALSLTLGGAAAAADLVLSGARVIAAPDEPVIDDGVVVIRDGRIAAIGARGEVEVPADAAVVDARGLTAVAGFWNSHVHIITPETLRSRAAPAETLTREMRAMFLRWGFTTVFDIASSLENTNHLRARIARGEVIGPDILSVGDPFYPVDGTPVYVRRIYEEFGLPLAEVASPAEGAARVRAQAAAGAQGVKMFTGAIVGGDIGVLPMDPALARAIVSAAHERRLPVFAHPTDDAGLAVALESGADVLAHTTPDTGPWDAARVRRLLSRGVALTPTLDLFQIEGRRAGLSAAAIERTIGVVQQQTGAFARAGGEILFGTDIGYTTGYDTSEEVRLLAGAGLDWRQMLASLTTVPAKRFGHGDRGRLKAGGAADLVLLEGNPMDDIGALSRARCTFRAGKPVYEATPGACAGSR